MYLKAFPTMQWQESTGERIAISHTEDLFSWGCLGKRRKPLLR
jgi:hypothetical protein